MSNPLILCFVIALLASCGERPAQRASVDDPAPAPATAAEEVEWILDDYRAAFALAEEQGKNVFIDFYADWCPPCRTLAEDYFPRPDYQEFLSGVVPLKVNVDNEPDFAGSYNVSSIPALILTDAEGNEIDRVEGVTGNAEAFLETLKNLGR